MINLEKYKDGLIKSGRYFGVNSNEIKKCDYISCDSCIFNEGGCDNNRLEWLFKEERLTITQKEKIFLNSVADNSPYWIARDAESEELYLFAEEPFYNDGIWEVPYDRYFCLNKNIFSFIENNKPWSVNELKKLNIEGTESDIELSTTHDCEEELEQIEQNLDSTNENFQNDLQEKKTLPKHCIDCAGCLCFTCQNDNYYVKNTNEYCCVINGKSDNNCGCDSGVSSKSCPHYIPETFPWNTFYEHEIYVHCGTIEEKNDFKEQCKQHDIIGADDELSNWFVYEENTCYDFEGNFFNAIDLNAKNKIIYNWGDFMKKNNEVEK